MKQAFLLPLLAISLSGCVTKSGLREPLKDVPPVRSASFRQSIGHLLGNPVGGGNRVTTLLNGDQIFPAMLAGIRSAKKTVTFETFVYEKGEVPKAFADALAERARAGVKVHVILDAHGGRKARTYLSDLRAAGVEIERYNRIWYPDIRRYNHRTHRKLLVIDGRVGFIGGVGIADEWAGNADAPEHWRDTHFRIEGPAVAELQGAFADNWLKTHEELLVGPDYFPALKPAGNVDGSVFYSSPRHGRYVVPLMYQLAIAAARERLQIANAYFVPDATTVDGLIAAAARGVKVQLLVPGRHIDQKAVRRASRKRWGKLLEHGIEIYEYEPTMMHAKLLIVDGFFVSVGSANFDSRSLRINDEANFNVLSAKFAAEQQRIFERDRRDSTQVTLENYKKKSLFETPAQTLQTPLESQL